MKLLSGIFALIMASSVSAGEVHIRKELSTSFRYDYSNLKRDEVKFELRGWYLKYMEPGFRGEKSFTVRGTSKNEVSGGKSVTALTEIKFQSESTYWSLPHGIINCISKNSFDLDELTLKTNSYGKFTPLIQFVHALSYTPINWPPVMETFGGPTYLTPVTSQFVMTAPGNIAKGEGQMQWTIMNVIDDVFEIDVTGKTLTIDSEVIVRGKLFWDPRRKLFQKIELHYNFVDPKKFPVDSGRLTSLEVKIQR